MASFVSNFFQSKDRASGDSSPRPTTPTKTNSFINPTSTPHGSPSKKTVPPGAHDLPSAFDNAMNLNSTGMESPVRLSRPQSTVTPLSPGKINAQPLEETSFNVEDSILHKSTATTSPLKKQGQENLPPQSQLNPAAVSRQQLYEPRERPLTGAKKFNTSRGLTAEELEILQKPNVRRMVNVTQLCKCIQS